MPLPCHCHVIAMPLPCHCHALAMPLPCHSHVTANAMSLPWHCRAIAMSLPCHCHDVAMSLPCHGNVIAMPLPCHCHGIAMTLPCHCHAIAMSLSSHCRAISMSLPCHGHAWPSWGHVSASRVKELSPRSAINGFLASNSEVCAKYRPKRLSGMPFRGRNLLVVREEFDLNVTLARDGRGSWPQEPPRGPKRPRVRGVSERSIFSWAR